ncbi:MAG: hypothetical protein HYU97_03495 [Deltaproteobacteria bacterium]|nr:hypothetical protein [Deltaproteobacteria bacterium]
MKKSLSFLTVFVFSLLVACGGGAPDVVKGPSLEEQLINNLSTIATGEGPSFTEKKATITEIEEWVLFTAQAAFEGNQGLIEQAMKTKNPNFTNLSMAGPLGGTISGSGQGKGEVLHLDSTFSDFAYTEISHDSGENQDNPDQESVEQQETKKQITLNGSSTEDYQLDTEKGEGYFSVDLGVTTATSGTYGAKISFSLQASFESSQENEVEPIEIKGLAAVESGSQVFICEFSTSTFAGAKERYHGANCKEKVSVQETAAPSTTQGGGGF